MFLCVLLLLHCMHGSSLYFCFLPFWNSIIPFPSPHTHWRTLIKCGLLHFKEVCFCLEITIYVWRYMMKNVLLIVNLNLNVIFTDSLFSPGIALTPLSREWQHLDTCTHKLKHKPVHVFKTNSDENLKQDLKPKVLPGVR